MNMRTKLQNGERRCRFLPHIINTAMSLFLRNRKSYDMLRLYGLLCLPDPRYLRKNSGQLKVKEGGDPLLYSMFQEEVQDRKQNNINKIIGRLILDEIKLKNGIAYNCNSNEVTGFIPQHIDTNNVYQNILDRAKKKKGVTKKCVRVYTNQWRFRSTHNLTHNADFFFHNGSLDGHELIRQLIKVVISYEFIGVKIFGLVSDAGGGNK